jgi:hypothetical protein
MGNAASDQGHMIERRSEVKIDLKSPSSLAKAFRASNTGRSINQFIKTYKSEFAATLGVLGAGIPYSKEAIIVWAILKQVARFKDKLPLFAQRIARLDASMTILQVLFSLNRAYMSEEARNQRSLRVDCDTGCLIPSPSSLKFWNKLLKRMEDEKWMKDINPDYFHKKLTLAETLVTMELTQLQAVLTIQQSLDTKKVKLDRKGSDALRRWRKMVGKGTSATRTGSNEVEQTKYIPTDATVNNIMKSGYGGITELWPLKKKNLRS